ncbi:MAG: shikimate kinase [Cyanobacteria bacterium J06638_28]
MTHSTHSDLLRGTNLYLIGMMGAGKSTLGTAMAAQLGYRFFDTDTLIEQVAGTSIPEIFATSGESGFRDLESEVLSQLSPYTRLVVATGGGIVLRSENWGHLRNGVIVWMDVALAELQQRLQGDEQRPLLQREDWPQHLATLLEQRRELYAQADIHLGVNAGDSVAELSDRLIALLEERVLPPPSFVQPEG